MNRIAKNIIKYRFIIIGLFLIGAIASFSLIDNVKVNYDNSEYLPQDSTATIDMNYVTDEIGVPNTISLMIRDVSLEKTYAIKEDLLTIPDIEVIIFDEGNGNYIEETALLTILLSKDVKDIEIVLSNLEDMLSSYEISISGEAANVHYQEQRIIQETPIALIASGIVILIILLLTTRSLFEPLVFGVVIGISIIINLGTNIIFDDISYITKSVTAILQLGLSMDYSIILIHSYYHEKEKNKDKDNKSAMINAITNSAKSITSSSLTTVIGLLALVFMTFTIGTDIGLVLSKGIIISLISVFLLLPNFILFIEKIPFNKYHRTINLSNFSLRKTSKHFSLILTISAVIFIGAMFIVQTNNNYTFVDATKYDGEEEIKEMFGTTNSFIVGIENNEYLEANEEAIITEINKKYEDKIVNYLGVTNSVEKKISYHDLYSLTTEENSKMIFALYALNNDLNHNISYDEYIALAEGIINNTDNLDASSVNQLLHVIELRKIKDNSYDNEELLAILEETDILNTEEEINDLITILYGFYSFDNSLIPNSNISPLVYLNTLLQVGTNNFSEEELTELTALVSSLNDLATLMSADVTKVQFQTIAYSNYGVTLDMSSIDDMYINYFFINQLPISDSIHLESLLGFIVDNELLPVTSLNQITATLQLKELLLAEISLPVMIPTINSIITSITGVPFSLEVDEFSNKVVLISSLSSLNRYNEVTINFTSFITYTETLITNGIFENTISVEHADILETLSNQLILLNSSTQLSINEMTQLLTTSPNEDLNNLSLGIYSKSLANTDKLDNYQIESLSLVNSIKKSSLIPLSISERNQIDTLYNELTTINNLISTDSISLLVINTSFDHESKTTEDFINFMYDEVLTEIDDETYFIGKSVSNLEIKEYFEQDLLKINFITIIAILVILTITFRSIVIPIILVFIIEGAIWTTLSISYFLGHDIFFISYIIIGAIQLGATIDYAIVLTHNYQKARQTTDKNEAIKIALKRATPTILTSASILTIAGFTISIVSTQATVVSIGVFLSRGTIISLITVLTILPSFLYSLDSLVIKKYQKRSHK